MSGASSEAGPSRLPSSTSSSSTTTTIPSSGPEFFEHRRRLFLAGLPLPPNPPTPLPKSYTIHLPYPDPLPLPDESDVKGAPISKLERLLAEDAAEETMETWMAGLGGVHARLDGGKKLARPLKLGLVIKVLKAGWIKDGTWPMDPRTRRAYKAPPSPVLRVQIPPGSDCNPARKLPPMPRLRVVHGPTPARPSTPMPSLLASVPGDDIARSPRSASFAQVQDQSARKLGGEGIRNIGREVSIRRETTVGDHG